MTTNEPEAPVTSDIRTQFHGELDHIQADGLAPAWRVDRVNSTPWR